MMFQFLKSVSFPFRLLVFWCLFFGIFRLWFVLWFHELWSKEQPGNAWLSFWHAIPLDLSFAAYLMLFPLLLWQIGIAGNANWRRNTEKAVNGFNMVLFGIFIFVFGANLFVYEEWQTPLNNRAVEYFKTPSSLLDSMSFPFKMASIGLYLGFFWLVFKGYKAIVGKAMYPSPLSRMSLALFPLWMGLLVLAIRGGLGVMPINESAVYFSPHLFDNHAATNPGWSLGHSLVETRSTKNRFIFMETADAQKRVSDLLQRGNGDVTHQFVAAQRSADSIPFYPPLNVVFLLLESHTAQVIEELGGEKDVCPHLSRLAREGILFEHCYGSGYRTDQGLVSILAGYPAQPDQSIILLDDKAAQLPSIPKVLKNNGYNTAFIYGGELTFANIGLWLTNQRFDKIISERDFSDDEKTQRWGVDDRLLLQRMIEEMNRLRSPFFAAALTLSVHPPYDVPYESRWKGTSDREKFLNSAAFTDEALGEFFRLAQQQAWFDQTLFLLVADHGASQPGGLGMDNPASRHTPLIIYGKPLLDNCKNRRIAAYGNHHDIPNLLFDILKQQTFTTPPQGFTWGRNLFTVDALENTRRTAAGERPSLGFAYYTNENGLGWATAHGKGFYEFGSREWRIFEGRLDSADRANAQAYLQVLYDDFLKK